MLVRVQDVLRHRDALRGGLDAVGSEGGFDLHQH
jgi:hypothetical protein